jgi:hypothetical protein
MHGRENEQCVWAGKLTAVKRSEISTKIVF